MSATNGYVSTAAERRKAAAAREASAAARDIAHAAMTLDDFVALKLAEAAPAAFVQEATRTWAIARHAELVARFR
jgi:hypothetical protein